MHRVGEVALPQPYFMSGHQIGCDSDKGNPQIFNAARTEKSSYFGDDSVSAEQSAAAKMQIEVTQDVPLV